MLRIGLTGGIGSGKSVVCRLFQDLGIPVVDTDLIAHELMQAGTEATSAILQKFGSQFLNKDGSLNRPALRELVFTDTNKLQQLESILHPLIRQEMERQISVLHSPYVILAIPLLVEKNWQDTLDRVLLVDCPVELQRERAMQRDGSSADIIDSIISRQADRTERLQIAEDIIDNSSSLSNLHSQVSELHSYYLNLVEQN